MKREEIRQCIDHSLSGIQADPALYERILCYAEQEEWISVPGKNAEDLPEEWRKKDRGPFRSIPAIILLLAVLLTGILWLSKSPVLSGRLQPVDTVSSYAASRPHATEVQAVSSTAGAAAQPSDPYLYTVLEDGTIEITRYLQTESREVIIPDTIDGYTVTRIGKEAFYQCYSIRSVRIPEGVTHIGSRAFSNCTSLVSVTIPDTVTLINSNVFEYCSSLVDIQIPDSVETVGAAVFFRCYSLRSVRLPDGITALYEALFSGCRSLETVSIPASVTVIGDNVFASCESLSAISLPRGLISIGNYAFGKCTGLRAMTIPKAVETIDKYAFLECKDLHFVVTEGSYAAAFCQKNGLPFHALPDLPD